MDQPPTRVRGEAKRHRGDGMRWCQTRYECGGIGIKPFGSPNDVGDKHRITPRSKVDWIDTGGLSTAGLRHRDQGFKRRGYSVDRLQRSDGGPMGGPPLRKRQSTVTSVARCDYGPPPLAGPKLKRRVTQVAFYGGSAVSRYAGSDGTYLTPIQQNEGLKILAIGVRAGPNKNR